MSKQNATWQLDRVIVASVLFTLVGLAQFVFATQHAMSKYPGGSIAHKKSAGYSWTANWLSDLGRQRAWNGAPNRESANFFNSSMVILGLCISQLFLVSLRGANEWSIAEFLTAGSGTIAGLGLIWIGLTPFDLYHNAHICGLVVWLVATLVLAAGFSYQSMHSDRVVAVVITMASLAFLMAVVVYAMSSTSSSVMLMQKICVAVAFLLLLLLLLRIALMALIVLDQNRTRYEIANAQATDYLRKLEKGKLRSKN